MEDAARQQQPSERRRRMKRLEAGDRNKTRSQNRGRKTRINIGAAVTLWRQVKQEQHIRTDPEMAAYLLDSYLGPTLPERFPELSTKQSDSSSSETLRILTGFSHRDRNAVLPGSAPTPHPPAAWESSMHETDDGEDAADASQSTQESWTVRTNNTESKSIQASPDLLCASTSVDDGPYLVDLDSSSQHVVDEGCIIKMLRTCLKCNKQCTIRKCVRGLHLIVYQSCYFCHCHFKWSSQPDSDVLIYGKYASLQYHHIRVECDRTAVSRHPPKLK